MVHIHTQARIHVHVHICIHLYTYIYMSMHLHTHIHTYTYNILLTKWGCRSAEGSLVGESRSLFFLKFLFWWFLASSSVSEIIRLGGSSSIVGLIAGRDRSVLKGTLRACRYLQLHRACQFLFSRFRWFS